MRLKLIAVLLVALLSGTAQRVLAEAASDQAAGKAAPILAGHSAHGEAFNEGPRQKAYLMAGMPNINFPITTSNEQAQKFFNQGVGQLHGFWYLEAERSFRQVAALDPDCGMAYWGMAMATFKNENRAKAFIKLAVERKAKAGRRDQLWIDSLAAFYDKKDDKERRKQLVKAWENLSFEFPDDIEVKALLVDMIWDNSSAGVSMGSRMAVDALAGQVLAANPMHPVHHYRIHLWNNEKDERALNSAALCGQTSPGIAHMWHMSGHTFSELRRYADAAWQQEASARVDHAHTMRDHLLPDQIHNYAHNNDWLIGDLSYIGRVHHAVEMAKNMIELPRVNANTSSYGMGRHRLFDMLRQYELWDELVALGDTVYLEPTDRVDEQIKRLRALGVAWLNKGDRAKGAEQLAALDAIGNSIRAERQTAIEAAEAKAKQENKPPDQIEKAKNDAQPPFAGRLQPVDQAVAELKLYQLILDKNLEEGRKQIEQVKEVGKPRLAQLWMQLEDPAKAETIAREAAEHAPNQVQPLANYVEILYRAGKKPQAIEQFERLKPLASQLDLDLPVCKRLEPMIKELNLSSDWRPPLVVPADAGQRPDLNSLGPFRWEPSPATAWSLPDLNGAPINLDQYRGKPLLMIFFLGSGCPHCVEQLNAFAPVTKEYLDAGISIVALSTDTVPGLKETFAQSKQDGMFPFPIVSDQELATFKAYRAFDDFENTPLHGVFLLDGAGLIRWQDIGHQPYKDVRFLLGEAKRLLALPTTPKQVAAAPQ